MQSLRDGNRRRKKEKQKEKKKTCNLTSGAVQTHDPLAYRTAQTYECGSKFISFKKVYLGILVRVNVISGNKSKMENLERNRWKRSSLSWHRKFLPLLAKSILSKFPSKQESTIQKCAIGCQPRLVSEAAQDLAEQTRKEAKNSLTDTYCSHIFYLEET